MPSNAAWSRAFGPASSERADAGGRRTSRRRLPAKRCASGSPATKPKASRGRGIARRGRIACGLRHIRTRPYTPKTNGKAERFIQTALREWAYAQAYPNSDRRANELSFWLHRYNWHRLHGSLKSQTPISRLALTKDNLLRLHTWISRRSAFMLTWTERATLFSTLAVFVNPTALVAWCPERPLRSPSRSRARYCRRPRPTRISSPRRLTPTTSSR
jgi:hypothetical protein